MQVETPTTTMEQGKLPRKPRSQAIAGYASVGHAFMRDQLSLQNWLLLGALVQAALALVLQHGLALEPLYAALPVFVFGTYKALQAITYVSSYKPGTHGQSLAKTGASFEDDIKSDGKICLLVLGTRSYHPLGVFGPGVKELGQYFTQMIKDLERNSQEYGFLGYNTYLGADGGERCNEIMGHYYFRNYEGLHKFAHSETHRKGWDWWNRTVKDHPSLGIFHETYEAPAGSWEAIYANYKKSGVMATHFPFQTEDGTHTWGSPIMDASKGRFRTSKGRMSRTAGEDNLKYGVAEYPEFEK